MENIFKEIQNAYSIAIAGHVRPDGDCVGSCLSLYQYLTKYYNCDRSKVIDLYLEPVPEPFAFLKNVDKIRSEYDPKLTYDLFIALDSSSTDRLGDALPYFERAARTICIDHHISNTWFADINIVKPDASSASEVLYDLLKEEKIDADIAECLYLGIVHDTGVFKHSNTSRHTMEIAGKLIEKGVNTSKIIDETFYQKTHLQNQILGRCPLESVLYLNGKVILSSVSRSVQELYGVVPADLDGVIDQLRITKGVEAAILLREEEAQSYKVSMRSNGILDVSKIAVCFGGGGHVKAAGCSMKGTLDVVVHQLLGHMTEQFEAAGYSI